MKKFKVFYLIFIHVALLTCFLGISSMHETYADALDEQEAEINELVDIAYDSTGVTWKAKYHSLSEEFWELYEEKSK